MVDIDVQKIDILEGRMKMYHKYLVEDKQKMDQLMTDNSDLKTKLEQKTIEITNEKQLNKHLSGSD